MRGVVLDTTALLKYLLKEPGWEEIHRLLQEESCYVLTSAVLEVLECVAMLEQRRAIPAGSGDTAIKAMTKLIDTGILKTLPDHRYAEQARELSTRLSIAPADALTIAAAREVGTLATASIHQAATAKKLGIKTILIP